MDYYYWFSPNEIGSEVHSFYEWFVHFSEFNLAMLESEAYRGLGQFEKSNEIYLQYLNYPQEFNLSSNEVMFIRIQTAFNYLAWGDSEFRQAHNAENKQNLLNSTRQKYEAALELFKEYPEVPNELKKIEEKIQALDELENITLEHLGESRSLSEADTRALWETLQPSGSRDIHSINPLIVEIIYHAKMQLLKISNHLNYLGYNDGYVPDQRYTFLLSRANEYADLAIQTEARYIQFKAEAENQEYQSQQLAQNAQLTVYQEQIAKTRGKIANDRQIQADYRMKAIDRKIKAKRNSSFWSSLAGGLSMMAGIVAAPVTGGASVVAGGLAFAAFTAGQIGQTISDDHQIAALQYEKQAVAIDKVIAGREGLIADMETTIAQKQGAFIRENLQYLSQKEFNQDLYYKLANALKRVKKVYLDAGIRMGFLAERALAFESGKDLRFVKFDYERSDLKNLLAGDFLKQDLVMMEYNRALELKQRNHVKHVISLRQQYPVEFGQFLETGMMDFATGLYEFDKAYPGTYHRRLKRVEVVIQGLVGLEGFKGSLTNFGNFIVRSKEGTLEAERLIPTDQEFREAYKGLKDKGLLAIPVGGVRTYQLPPTRLVLSKYDIRQDGIIFPAEQEVREIFEGFGVSGLWQLELPKHLNDVDFRSIADVQVILYFDALYDPDLEHTVKELVWKYEKELSGGQRLDQTVAFSMRQHFPDEFFSFSGGEITFELLDGDFPAYMAAKNVKNVILRAVDKEGNGISGLDLHINKLTNPLNSLSLSATTFVDGYTVDVGALTDPAKTLPDLPLEQRVPIVGAWQVKLTDTSRAKEVDDLIVIFSYEYKPEEIYLPGLFGAYYKSEKVIEDYPNWFQDPVHIQTDLQVNFPPTDTAFNGLVEFVDNFGVYWSGQIKIPTAGEYTFYLNSDDGSHLYIDGKSVVDNDGLHGMEEKSGSIELTEGFHDVELWYFEKGRGAGIIFSWESPSFAKEVVPASALSPDSLQYLAGAWSRRSPDRNYEFTQIGDTFYWDISEPVKEQGTGTINGQQVSISWQGDYGPPRATSGSITKTDEENRAILIQCYGSGGPPFVRKKE